MGTEERSSLNDEFTALRSEIDRISAVTEFNGRALLDGALSSGVVFQVGLNNNVDDQITVSLLESTAPVLGLGGTAVNSITTARGTHRQNY